MTKTKIAGLALAALLAGSLAACAKPAATPAVDTSKIAATLTADMDALVASFNAKDVAAAVAHDSPTYVGMFHGQPNVVGPEADLALTKIQVADPAAKVTVSNAVVDVASAGDMAVYRATYAYTYTNPTTHQPGVENGNWVLGYKVQPDGSWKLAWGVVSDTGPAATAG